MITGLRMERNQWSSANKAIDEGTLTAILVPEGTEGVAVNTPIAELNGGAGAATAPAAP